MNTKEYQVRFRWTGERGGKKQTNIITCHKLKDLGYLVKREASFLRAKDNTTMEIRRVR